jgi:hypothetical protein
MGKILEHWRIFTAVLFSAVLIVGAYVFARGVESPPIAQASTEAALLKAIATKDSNGDGLPDWEKSLYGIPINSTTTDYFHLGMTDVEAVAKGLIVPKAIANIPVATSSPVSFSENGLPPPPAEGTLTNAFAKSFFSLYLTARQNAGGADLSDVDLQNIANEAISSLSESVTVAPDFKSASDLIVSGSGADAMKAFAVSADAVFMKNTTSATASEIIYLKNALLNNDTTAFPQMVSIAKVYRDTAIGLAMLRVPKEIAAGNLELVNSMMRMSEITSDFARANTDPLAVMLALQQYQQATQSLGKAFIDIASTYSAAGISFPAGAPGAAFVNVIPDVTAAQQAATENP